MKIEDIEVTFTFRTAPQSLIEKLKEDIRQNGLQNPIIVRKRRNNTYVLIDGLRRLTAVKELGWNDINVKVI